MRRVSTVLTKRTAPVAAPRKLRADSLRNRERLIEAAKAIFGRGETDATLEVVARTAGVGIGTLYRHFPTRDALFQAVCRNEVEELSLLAERLSSSAEPVEALRVWLHDLVDAASTKKAMLGALAIGPGNVDQVNSYAFDRLVAAIDLLLLPSVAAGLIRPRLAAAELLHAVVGLCSVIPQPKPGNIKPVVDVLIDGLTAR